MSGRAATDAVIRGRCAISVNNPGHPIPLGWVRVALTDVAELGTGHTPSRLHPEYWDGDVPWIGIRDAGAHHGGTIRQTAQHVTPLGLVHSAARLLPKDTVCLSRTASVGYVVKMGQPMATSQDFVTWSCSEALDPDYLMRALLAEGQDIRRFGEGSTHTTIYFPKVKAFNIDLPPLAEQSRIVEKLGILTTRVARVRAVLERVSKLTHSLRANILWNAFDLDHMRLKGIMIVKVGDVAEVTSGYGFPKHLQGKGKGRFPFAKVSDISQAVLKHRGRLHDAVNYVDHADLKKMRAKPVPPGSTVFAKIGEALRLNRRALTQQDVVLDNNCMALTPYPCLEPEYLYRFMQTVDLSPFAVATAVPSVRRGDVMALLLPLPSRDTQLQQLDTIETAFARADRLDAEAARATKLLDRLEASILAKAFRGELVPQDPADEPASALFDRIRSERGSPPKARRGRVSTMQVEVR